MNRREDLLEDEHGADASERADERRAELNRRDDKAGRDRKQRGEHSAKHQHRPPAGREPWVGPDQDAEELPFLALPQLRHHRESFAEACVHEPLARH